MPCSRSACASRICASRVCTSLVYASRACLMQTAANRAYLPDSGRSAAGLRLKLSISAIGMSASDVSAAGMPVFSISAADVSAFSMSAFSMSAAGRARAAAADADAHALPKTFKQQTVGIYPLPEQNPIGIAGTIANNIIPVPDIKRIRAIAYAAADDVAAVAANNTVISRIPAPPLFFSIKPLIQKFRFQNLFSKSSPTTPPTSANQHISHSRNRQITLLHPKNQIQKKKKKKKSKHR